MSGAARVVRVNSTGRDRAGYRPFVPATPYNAAAHLVDQHLTLGRADRTAFIEHGGGRYSYADFAERVNRAGNALHGLGVQMEQRVLLLLHDTIDFPALFFGAMKIGSVPAGKIQRFTLRAQID